MRILLLADLHMGARLLDWGDRGASHRGEPRRAWTDAVELALSEEAAVDMVLVAGDLFDRPDPDPELAAAVTGDVARLLEAGRKVVILPGAYDGLCLPGCVYLAGSLPGDCLVVDWPEPRRVDLTVGTEALHLYTFASIPGRSPEDPFAALRREEGDGYHLGLAHARLEGEPAAHGALDWGRPALTRADAGATGMDLLVVGGGHDFRSEICGLVPTIQPGSPVRLRPADDPSRSFTLAALGPEGVEVERPPREKAPSADPASAGEVAADSAFLSRVRKEGSVRGLFARRLETLLGETDDPVERDILQRALALGLDEFNRLEVPHAG